MRQKIMENAMHTLAKTIAAVSFIAAFLSASAASADVLLAKSTTSDFDIAPGSAVSVPLDKKGNTVLNFETTKKGTIIITYNAECSATGDVGDWVGLQILVDGKPTNPKASPSDFAFCSAVGGTNVYSAVSRQAYVTLNAGPHSVEVLASLHSGADSGRLDDSSIVIVD
jgi:hypothetical protein